MGLLWKCAVVVLASTVQSLGLTLQRLSHLDPPLPASGVWPSPDQRKHSVQLWRLGLALFVGANLFGSSVQLAVLPLVLVSTLQAMGLVANAVFASLILKEPLTPHAAVGTVLVIAGAGAVAGLGGAPADPDVSLDELLALFASLRFAAWMTLTLAVAAGLIAQQARRHPGDFRVSRAEAAPDPELARGDFGRDEPVRGDFSRAEFSYTDLSRADLTRPELSRPDHRASLPHCELAHLGLYRDQPSSDRSPDRQDRFSGWAWGVVGGVASAHSLLMAKLAIGLVVRDYRHPMVDLERLQFWLILALFLTFALGQMWCVNCGLRHASTSVLYPLVFCVYNLGVIGNSVMLYGPHTTTPGQLAWIAAGTAVLFSGVFLLSTRFEGESPGTGESPSWLRWLRGKPGPLSSRTSVGSAASHDDGGISLLASPISPFDGPVSPSPRLPDSPRTLQSPKFAPDRTASSGLQRPPSASSFLLSTPTRPGAPRFADSGDLSGSPSSESMPLLNSATYTSFDSISPSITNPDRVRGRHSRVVLSKEQNRLLRELGM